MATPQLNRGLSTVVTQPRKSFTDYAVDTERRKRERKESAISEARQLLISKQSFAPYSGAVNEFLNNAIDEIATADDLDSSAYTRAVEQYMEYYNNSKQVEQFLRDAAKSYQADKEVNEQVAAKAIMDRYVKDRSIEELSQLAGQQMDAEDVILKTPGALKTDVVLEDRLNRFGEIIMQYTQQSDKARSIGGGNMVLEGENIMRKYKQYVKKDGNNIYVDPQALQDKGFFDVLMSDARVKAIAERQLEDEGITPPPTMASVAEKKAYTQQVRDKLAGMMTPFVDYTEETKRQDRYMSNWYARRSTRSSTGKKDDAFYFNNWYRDLLGKDNEAASYLKGAEIPITSLPISQQRMVQLESRGLTGDVVIADAKVSGLSPDPFGASQDDLIEIRVKNTKEDEGEDTKAHVITMPISALLDSEAAALLYEQSRKQRNRVHYKESEGVAGSVTPTTGKTRTAADILNNINNK